MKIIWREIKEGEELVMLVATYKGAALVVMPSGVWSVTSARGASAGSVEVEPSLRRGMAMDKAEAIAKALMRGKA
jgi:hypothetical protein